MQETFTIPEAAICQSAKMWPAVALKFAASGGGSNTGGDGSAATKNVAGAKAGERCGSKGGGQK